MKKIIMAVVALALVGAGVAYATIPDESGVIHACYNKTSGVTKIVESTSSCASNENAISWNQTGAPGSVGAAGPAGPAGPGAVVVAGPDVTLDANRLAGDAGYDCSTDPCTRLDTMQSVTIPCPSGDSAIGRAYAISRESGVDDMKIILDSDHPSGSDWNLSVTGAVRGTTYVQFPTLHTWVICQAA